MKDARNNEIDSFFENYFSYAIVVRADINKINELKQYLAQNNFTICFQKLSTEKLWIKEDRGNDDQS
jgi:hypothetical protein